MHFILFYFLFLFFSCPYSNSAVGIGHRYVYVRVADAPTAEPGMRCKDSSTVAGYSCNVLLCYNMKLASSYVQPAALA